jgi:hypothetical protein
MVLPISKKRIAHSMRAKGYSLAEISNSLNVAKSTASVWVKNVILTQIATLRIGERKRLGRKKAELIAKAKRVKKNLTLQKSVNELFTQELIINKAHLKLLASFLYWGEGSKDSGYVSFINSDPNMMKTFITLLRKAFAIEEEKFSILIHVHSNQDEGLLKEFWSKVTGVPLTQFTKSYSKPNSKKRVKEGYMGCCRLRYYDVSVVRELKALYNTFSLQDRAVVQW